MMLKPVVAVSLAAALTLGGCTTPQGTPNRQGSGALAGAAAGGILGGLISGRPAGAAIGAAAGAIAGGAIGYNLDKQAGELRSSFDNRIGVTNAGDRLIVTMPQDILFATDSARLTGTLRSDLATLAQSLNKYPNSTVQVVGHTDNTGSAAYNLNLSRQRAQAVSSVLAANGVSSGRISSIGRGEDVPVASNLTPAGRAQNRRVEIVIIPNG